MVLGFGNSSLYNVLVLVTLGLAVTLGMFIFLIIKKTMPGLHLPELKSRPKIKDKLKEDREIKKKSGIIVNKINALLKKEKNAQKRKEILEQVVDELHKKGGKGRGLQIKLEPKFPTLIKKEKIVEKGIDQETKNVLRITDELLGRLPDDVIEEFSKSPDFEIYKKVMEKVVK